MNDLRPKPSISYLVLVILLLLCVLGPLTSFVDAFVARTIWGWYLSVYGPGPTLWQWFGIMTILGLPLIDVLVKQRRRDEDGPGHDFASRAIKVSSLKVSIALAVLLSAGIVHVVAS